MAETTEVHPSLEGIFRVLARIPEDKLVQCKYKLNSTKQDWRSCKRLRAMILLTLRRETEARVSLEALGDDVAAAHIYQSHWGSASANRANPIPLNQDPEVVLAVARIFSLLVDEKLCGALARDEAYRAAVKAFHTNNAQGSKLESLLGEARDKCGLDFTPAVASHNVCAPSSGAGTSLAGAAKSSPVPIPSSWAPSDLQPLRSTGSPTSLISHFEISQSPTMLVFNHSAGQHGIPEPSKLFGSSVSPLVPPGKGGDALESPDHCSSEKPMESSLQDQPTTGHTGGFRGNLSSPLVWPHLTATQPREEAGQGREPWNTVAEELQDPEGSSLQNPQALPAPLPAAVSSAGLIQRPVEDSSSSTQRLSSASSSALPPSGSPTTDPQGDEQQFFTFVVVHASEDETIACRVREQLETMGVSNGATFNEDFLVPGHCQLSCFQDVLDNSAFTLLLLTENFKSRLCTFQANMALMDSFERFLKTNSVIPFVPKENPIKRGEMPCLLAGLVPLDENSHVFARRVKNTFAPAVIREKKVAWSYFKQVHDRERLQEQHQDYRRVLQRLSALSVNLQAPVALQAPQVGFSGLQVPPGQFPEPFCQATFPVPGMPQHQPGPDLSSVVVSLGPPSMLSGGPPPHLIIQNAQMVQIGDYNQMQVERTNAALGTGEEEVGVDQWNRHED
ncbi:TIR domain-containing adapter molecule 1 [Rhineura floridana]|uniref:TIR domain-containing adapter molecule 1 n=1 Tax=Rhineura floridana TaxID=261503 RepID=UPI002AC854A5|nr:TIR domain-containing adapter molecule 1 [Rhineura floridana]